VSKFIEDCNRLLPDGAADSARCMGLSVILENIRSKHIDNKRTEQTHR